MSNGVTLNGAETKLKSFFRDVEGDYVSVETIFRNEDRNLHDQKHKNWFYNYSSILRKYNLAIPLKGVRSGVSVTLGLTLTDKGRSVLGNRLRENKSVVPNAKQREATLAGWRIDGYALRAKHPELVIEFDVRMRKDNE